MAEWKPIPVFRCFLSGLNETATRGSDKTRGDSPDGPMPRYGVKYEAP